MDKIKAHWKQITDAEKALNYCFENKSYLLEALTHSSYANENKMYRFNERLEFLGDSVLSLIITTHIYKEANVPEGELTKIRSNIVCEESLSLAAEALSLGKYMLLGRGEECNGGRLRASILADVFEAVIAAIYLDGGLDRAKEFILKNLDGIIKGSLSGEVFRDYKTYLQELIQSKGSRSLTYILDKEIGPDHCKEFVMSVKYNNEILGSGKGKSKKESEQAAAKSAIANLKRRQVVRNKYEK